MNRKSRLRVMRGFICRRANQNYTEKNTHTDSIKQCLRLENIRFQHNLLLFEQYINVSIFSDPLAEIVNNMNVQ